MQNTQPEPTSTSRSQTASLRGSRRLSRTACLVFALTFSIFLVSAEKSFGQYQPAGNSTSPQGPPPTPQQRREEFERQRTLELLKNQTNEAGQRLLAPTNPALVNSRINGELQTMQTKHAQTLDNMRNATILVPDDDSGVMQSVPRYSPGEIYSKQQSMQREEQDYLDAMQRQEANNLRYAQGRAADLQTDADNLASQLKETSANQSFRLNPVGTNMYVRNFETVGTEPPETKTLAPLTARSQSVPAKVGGSVKATIPPGWNPLEEPGRKPALQATRARQDSLSKSKPLRQSTVKN